MSANGPVVVATPDQTFTFSDAVAHALSAVSGIGFSEQLAVAAIEAVVYLGAATDATGATVTLWRGPAITGTALQDFVAPATTIAAADSTPIPVRFLDAQPPGANVRYSLSVRSPAAADGYTVTVYGFTVTTFPGGVTVLAYNG